MRNWIHRERLHSDLVASLKDWKHIATKEECGAELSLVIRLR